MSALTLKLKRASDTISHSYVCNAPSGEHCVCRTDKNKQIIGEVIDDIARLEVERDEALARNHALVLKVRDECIRIIKQTWNRNYEIDKFVGWTDDLVSAIRDRVRPSHEGIFQTVLTQLTWERDANARSATEAMSRFVEAEAERDHLQLELTQRADDKYKAAWLARWAIDVHRKECKLCRRVARCTAASVLIERSAGLDNAILEAI